MRSFKYVGRLVKEKREALINCCTQAEASEALGYKNGQFISNIERALCTIPFKNMSAFIDFFDITKSELREALLKDYEDSIRLYFDSKETFSASENDLASS